MSSCSFTALFSTARLHLTYSYNMLCTCRRKGKIFHQTLKDCPLFLVWLVGKSPRAKMRLAFRVRLACFYRVSPCAGRMGPGSPPATLLLESQPMPTVHTLPSEPAPGQTVSNVDAAFTHLSPSTWVNYAPLVQGEWKAISHTPAF